MILEKSHDQIELAREQVTLCDQMKVAIERYFSSFNDNLEETNYILTDWTTPQNELYQKCKKQVYLRCFDIEKHQMTYCMSDHWKEFHRNQLSMIR